MVSPISLPSFSIRFCASLSICLSSSKFFKIISLIREVSSPWFSTNPFSVSPLTMLLANFSTCVSESRMACIYRSSKRLSLEAWNYMFKKLSFTLLLIFFFFLLSFVLYYFHLNSIIKGKFEGRKWDIPSKVFSGNYLLYPGLKLHVQQFEERLTRLKYRKINIPHPEQGEYFFNSSTREISDLFI